jgi:hypothetical protein
VQDRAKAKQHGRSMSIKQGYFQQGIISKLSSVLRYEEAYAIYMSALGAWRESLGSCHPDLASLLSQIALCSRQLGKLENAEILHR